MTNPDAQSNPNQAAIDAQAETQTSQYGGGSAMLDAEAALSEQPSSDPTGEAAATNASSSNQADPNAASQNAASGYPIDTAQADGNVALRDVQQGD